MDISKITGTWDYSALPPTIRVGRDCFLENKASFKRVRTRYEPGLIIGDRVKIYTWSAFSIEPDGLIVIGDDTTLVGAVLWCAERIEIGKCVVISYNVVLADSDFHPRDPVLRQQDAIAVAPGGDLSQRPPFPARPIIIEDDAQIGIGAIILKGVHIGAGACIGAGAVVSRDVPAGATVVGNPARVVDGGTADERR